MPVRKIYFFRAYVGSEGDGRPRNYDPGPPLRHINTLSFTNGGRYLEGDDDNAYACWPDRLRRPFHTRMGKIRRSDLPQVEREGDLQDLDIPRDSGLIEQAHFAFFDNNVVGMVFNFYGPRAGSFAHYLREKHAESSSMLRLDPFVKDRLVSPGSADFPFLDRPRVDRVENRWEVISYVDSQNRFGATLRSNFRCLVEHQGGDRWKLLDLQLTER